MHGDMRNFIIGSLLLLTCCNNNELIRIKNSSEKGDFSLQKTEINVSQVNFDNYTYKDDLGYTRLDAKAFRSSNQEVIAKKYDAVIIENKYIKLTLLPGRGKPYSLIYKVTGHEEFFIPEVAQVMGSPNKLGWWFALGGIEYTMPDEEHGETWAALWEWEILEDSRTRKTVRMCVKELRFGLEETITISVFPDKAYFEAAISITNPTDSTVKFQHWINPMWVPGGLTDGLTPNTEFIIPAKEVYATERPFNNWMLGFDPDSSRLQPYDNNPMRFFKNWKSHGDLLALDLEHGFYSAYSHEEEEGIVRVFPVNSNPGCNIWTFGFDPPLLTRRRFSGNEIHNGYVEMWGGITSGFKEYYPLEPGKSISWTEWMYPYINLKGLHYADDNFAVTFLETGSDNYEVNLCPSGDIKGIDLKVVSPSSGKTYLRVKYKSVFPEKENRGFSFDAGDKDIELIVSLKGKEIIRLKPSPYSLQRVGEQ